MVSANDLDLGTTMSRLRYGLMLGILLIFALVLTFDQVPYVRNLFVDPASGSSAAVIAVRDHVGQGTVFAAGGDIGATTETASVLKTIAASDAQFFLALGDLSYNQLKPESAWCDWTKTQLGPDTPIQLTVGNHEDDDGPDGSIRAFADCAPDHMGSTGTYPAQYFFDLDQTVRVISIAPGLTVDGVTYDYAPGSDEASWLISAIESGQAAGIPWIVVGSHKPCITVGAKDCEPGSAAVDLMIDEGVDLILFGHDHNYQRSHQLTCITLESFDPDCVSDNDGNHVAGAGTIMVVAGVSGGRIFYSIDPEDPEGPYFATSFGRADNEAGVGYIEIAADDDTLEVRFIGVTATFTDGFTMHQRS